MSTLDNPNQLQTNAPIWKTALVWGGYASVVGILSSLLMFLFDYNPMSGGMSGMFIMIIIGLILAGIFAALAIR